MQRFGGQLFLALLPDEVLSCYRSSRTFAGTQGKGLRLRVRIDAPKMFVLPWEYLYDKQEGDYVCLAKETPLIRHMELPRPSQPLTIQPPLRILGMISSPTDLPALNVELEKQHMTEAVQHLSERGQIAITWIAGATWRDLQKAMDDGPWHVFHFIGHGDFDAQEEEGVIALCDERGQSSLMSATQLGRLLAGHASLGLVVLNACESARASSTDLFSSTASILTRRGVPAVVSMQYPISDRAALEFSRMFYDSLASELPVESAVTLARIAMSMTMRDSFEWATPVLHMRSPDGRLFDINSTKVLFPQGAPKPVLTPPPVIDPHLVPGGLSVLLNKVKRFWIEGVLDESLGYSGLIDLELDTLPEMVLSPWGNTPIDPQQPISALCDELGGSLLILGNPGAGKTTLMLTLVRELISRRELDNSLPIPVVANLTSWIDNNQDLSQWMIDELGAKYGVPKQIAQSWLQQGRLRLFLDGLDEVTPERRAACVTAINAFLQKPSMISVVVCCRFAEYIDLPVRLALNGALRLRALSRNRIMAHVAAARRAFRRLQVLLEQDSSLLILAQTPFMLSMMFRTYRDLPAEQQPNQNFATIEERKKQLMTAYVERQFRLAAVGS